MSGGAGEGVSLGPAMGGVGGPPPLVRIFRGLGWAGLLVALVLGVRRGVFVAHAKHARGTIVRFDAVQPMTNRRPAFRTVFRYQPEGGGVVEVTTSAASSPGWFAGTIGGSIPVLYDPGDPRRALPDTWMELWFPAAVCAGAGMFLLGFAAILSYALGRADGGRRDRVGGEF